MDWCKTGLRLQLGCFLSGGARFGGSGGVLVCGGGEAAEMEVSHGGGGGRGW